MATYVVNNSTALLAALKHVNSGDTIALNSGAYTPVNITNVHFSGNVTITSADAAHQAVLSGLSVTNSSGLTFSKLNLSTVGATREAPFGIYTSSNVTVSNLEVYGAGANVQETGFVVEKSSNIVINGSSFSNLMNAVQELNNTNVVISNNTFTAIGGDGVDNGGTSNIVVSGNHFSNFEPAGTQHSDAIQFWTSNTTSSASNITITDNVMTQGASNAYQGIFLTDQVGNLPYKNVTISNNSITGGLWNGIEVGHGVNVSITNNTLTSLYDGSSATNPLSRILLFGTTGATVSNNTAAQVVFDANDSLINQMGNLTNTFVNSATGALKATAPTQALNEMSSISGNVALSDVAGANPIVATVNSDVVSSAGTVVTGLYGKLTIHSDGAYTYDTSTDGLLTGKVYTETFHTVVKDSLGHSSTVYLQFQVTGTTPTTHALAAATTGSLAASTLLTGANTLVGGPVADTFAYSTLAAGAANNHSTIIGFKAGDTIDLSQVDPAFRIVSAFDHHAHELVLHNDGNGAWDIYGDTTGSGIANFHVHLVGATTALNTSSFHL